MLPSTVDQTPQTHYLEVTQMCSCVGSMMNIIKWNSMIKHVVFLKLSMLRHLVLTCKFIFFVILYIMVTSIGYQLQKNRRITSFGFHQRRFGGTLVRHGGTALVNRVADLISGDGWKFTGCRRRRRHCST